MKKNVAELSDKISAETEEKNKCLTELKTKDDSIYELKTLLSVSQTKTAAPEKVPDES